MTFIQVLYQCQKLIKIFFSLFVLQAAFTMLATFRHLAYHYKHFGGYRDILQMISFCIIWGGSLHEVSVWMNSAWDSLILAEWCIYKPPLAQIMACCLFGTKPLSEPLLAYGWLDTWEQICKVIYWNELYHPYITSEGPWSSLQCSRSSRQMCIMTKNWQIQSAYHQAFWKKFLFSKHNFEIICFSGSF